MFPRGPRAPARGGAILPQPIQIEQTFQSGSEMKYLYWQARQGR
jgi:hypothetical protein